MTQDRDSVKNTFTVAFTLCIVCSVIVSAAAVLLRPAQEANKENFKRRNVLSAAGLYKEGTSIAEAFEQITTKIVDLETGEYLSDEDIKTKAGVESGNANDFDQKASSKNLELSAAIDAADDIATLKRREKYAAVYIIEKNGKIDQIILPIKGYGLWSTLYGFLALDGDLQTIRGITYYEHGETPGLGGEVDNESWKASWIDKKAFDDDGNIAIVVAKGKVDTARPEGVYQVDGLSGATITSRGVTNMLLFWLGENGFGPYLNRLREAGDNNG